MIAFIKDYNLEKIRKKFFLLYILNVTDIIFTVLLLQTGYFAELNFLMAKAVQDPILSVLLKILLPAVLLFIMYQRIKSADQSQLKAANIALIISISIYTLVNMSHLVWVALLPVFMKIS
jgi:hypothetical protein